MFSSAFSSKQNTTAAIFLSNSSLSSATSAGGGAFESFRLREGKEVVMKEVICERLWERDSPPLSGDGDGDGDEEKELLRVRVAVDCLEGDWAGAGEPRPTTAWFFLSDMLSRSHHYLSLLLFYLSIDLSICCQSWFVGVVWHHHAAAGMVFSHACAMFKHTPTFSNLSNLSKRSKPLLYIRYMVTLT